MTETKNATVIKMPVYRLLERNEWHRVEKIFQENGTEPPQRDISLIVVEEMDGEITQLLTLQLVAHSEPWWVREDQKGKGGSRVRSMFNVLDGVAKSLGIQEYFAFAPDETTARVARIVGMTEIPGWKVFKKEVK